MTSAYTQDLIHQRDRALAERRTAENELAQWRRQGRRADRYRAAWLSARRRATSWNTLYRAIAADRDRNLGSGPWITLRGHQAALRRVHARRSEADIARIAAEARIADLTPCIERVSEAAGRMVEHWADASSTGNTEWRNDMWTELHRAVDALAATLVGKPVPVNVPDGACGAYTARHGAVCTRPAGHPEAYHRDAMDRVYWLAEAQP